MGATFSRGFDEVDGDIQFFVILFYLATEVRLNSKRSIPVTRKERQLKKEEPHNKIEMHLADVTTQSNRRFTMNLYTESQDCTSH